MACGWCPSRNHRQHRLWCVIIFFPPRYHYHDTTYEGFLYVKREDYSSRITDYEFRMGSVNLVVIVESIRTLVTKNDDSLEAFHLPSIIAVAAALGK